MFNTMNEKELLTVNGGAYRSVPVYSTDGRILTWQQVEYDSEIQEFWFEVDWRAPKNPDGSRPLKKVAYNYHKFRY